MRLRCTIPCEVSETGGNKILKAFIAGKIIMSIRYTLIHNLNYWAPFPIDQDGYLAPTFQDILNRTRTRSPLPWRITLKEYYYR